MWSTRLNSARKRLAMVVAEWLERVTEKRCQIVIRQSVYDAGIRSLRSDQLRLDVERSSREADLAELDLSFAVRQQYSDALRVQEEVDLRRLYNGGTASYADVLKSEMQTSRASLALEKDPSYDTAPRYPERFLIPYPLRTWLRHQ